MYFCLSVHSYAYSNLLAKFKGVAMEMFYNLGSFLMYLEGQKSSGSLQKTGGLPADPQESLISAHQVINQFP